MEAGSAARRVLVFAAAGVAALLGYELLRGLVSRGGLVVALYGPLVGLEERIFGAPLSALLWGHRGPLLDAVMGLVYASHPAYFAVLMVYLAYREPGLFQRGLYAFVMASVVALAFYAAAPSAPPWLALPGLTRPGNPVLALARGLGGEDPNPYAAFPSMHVCLSVLAAGLLAELLRGSRLPWAWPVAMSFATVYTGNHYLADVAAGWVLGLASLRAAARLAPPRRGRRQGERELEAAPAGLQG